MPFFSGGHNQVRIDVGWLGCARQLIYASPRRLYASGRIFLIPRREALRVKKKVLCINLIINKAFKFHPWIFACLVQSVRIETYMSISNVFH